MQCKGPSDDAQVLRQIRVLLFAYIFDSQENTFKRLPDMPDGIPLQLHNAMLALDSIDEGQCGTICLTHCMPDCMPDANNTLSAILLSCRSAHCMGLASALLTAL